MFSPWYAEALRGILHMEEPDAARLEQQLANNPGDMQSRLKLMAYHQRADRSAHALDRSKHIRHALWLIQHHPESELLHSPVSRFAPGELDATEYRRAIALWDAAAKARPEDAAVQWNAATFFEGLDPVRHMRFLEQTAAADPNHPFALRPLAHLYALSMLRGGPLAQRAQSGLEASQNVWVLGNAAYMLQSQYNQSLQSGSSDRRAAELAERYFLRARNLNPNLDRKAILPELDRNTIARSAQTRQQTQQQWEARVHQAVPKIRRLPVNAFPRLPAAVSRALRQRNCTIPQPRAAGAPENVIRGEFFAKGQNGWAVFCSVNHATKLLVFRSDEDSNPAVVNTTEDRAYVQFDGETPVYSRHIRAVGRDFIITHYRAHGGPKPPPVDHNGIDDAFLDDVVKNEKASITWYFHNGKWLQLPGVD